MHAVLTRAIEQTVLALHGQQVWDAICEDAGLPAETLRGQRDALGLYSFELATAASRQLGLVRAELLEACGEYWVAQALSEEQGDAAQVAYWSHLPEGAPHLGRLHAVYLLAQRALSRFGGDTCMLLPTGHGALEVQVPGAGMLVREMLVGVCKALSRAAGVAAAVRLIAPEDARGLAIHRVEVSTC